MEILKNYRCLLWSRQAENNYKCFIGYKDDNHKIKPLSIMPLKAKNSLS